MAQRSSRSILLLNPLRNDSLGLLKGALSGRGGMGLARWRIGV
jgi:hypothetical protein